MCFECPVSNIIIPSDKHDQYSINQTRDRSMAFTSSHLETEWQLAVLPTGGCSMADWIQQYDPFSNTFALQVKISLLDGSVFELTCHQKNTTVLNLKLAMESVSGIPSFAQCMVQVEPPFQGGPCELQDHESDASLKLLELQDHERLSDLVGDETNFEVVLGRNGVEPADEYDEVQASVIHEYSEVNQKWEMSGSWMTTGVFGFKPANLVGRKIQIKGKMSWGICSVVDFQKMSITGDRKHTVEIQVGSGQIERKTVLLQRHSNGGYTFRILRDQKVRSVSDLGNCNLERPWYDHPFWKLLNPPESD
jgi:hypothetical protein